MDQPEIPGYQIQEVIGKGGMGVVYRARQIALDRIVALKVLNPDFATDREFVESFTQEAKTVAKLQHPNIISVYDFGCHKGHYYLSMQYVQGRTLRDLMVSRSPSIDECVAILTQVADALDYAHREEVLHRDVKPGNIMLRPDGRALVMDFGVACGSHAGDMSSVWMAVGTPNYMSPEQCKGRKASPRSDQYSVGIVAYEMLAGHLPFIAREPLAVMQQQLSVSPPPLRLGRTDITPRMEAAVMRALSKLPEVRFESVGAFARELEAASREAPAGEMLSGVTPSARPSGVTAAGPVSLTGEPAPLMGGSSSYQTTRTAYPNATVSAVRGAHPRRRSSFCGWMVVLVLFAAMGTGAYFLYLHVSNPPASERAKIAAPTPSSPRGPGHTRRKLRRSEGAVAGSRQPQATPESARGNVSDAGKEETTNSETTAAGESTPNTGDTETEKPKPSGESEGDNGGGSGA